LKSCGYTENEPWSAQTYHKKKKELLPDHSPDEIEEDTGFSSQFVRQSQICVSKYDENMTENETYP